MNATPTPPQDNKTNLRALIECEDVLTLMTRAEAVLRDRPKVSLPLQLELPAYIAVSIQAAYYEGVKDALAGRRVRLAPPMAKNLDELWQKHGSAPMPTVDETIGSNADEGKEPQSGTTSPT